MSCASRSLHLRFHFHVSVSFTPHADRALSTHTSITLRSGSRARRSTQRSTRPLAAPPCSFCVKRMHTHRTQARLARAHCRVPGGWRARAVAPPSARPPGSPRSGSCTILVAHTTERTSARPSPRPPARFVRMLGQLARPPRHMLITTLLSDIAATCLLAACASARC